MKVVRDKAPGACYGVRDAVRQPADQGRHILILGQPGHADVRGLARQLPKCEVVPDAESVRDYKHNRLVIVIHSSTPPSQLREIWAHIQLHNPLADIRFVDAALFLQPDARHDKPRAWFDLVSGAPGGYQEEPGSYQKAEP